jgi:hypothetical protein
MSWLKISPVLFIFLGLHFKAHAEEILLAQAAKPAAAAKAAKPARENLLDFEAEVIEGEKKRPELFLDIKAGDGNVGSGLYMRPNFDDFFAVDKKRRPRFVKSK